MSAQRPLPTIIGPTENALRAMLTKILSTTGIKTYSDWVIMNHAANAGAANSPADWRQTASDALKISVADVEDRLAELHTSGLLNADFSQAPRGVTELAKARSAVSSATSSLVDGIADEEQRITKKVLELVRSRAEEMLRQ